MLAPFEPGAPARFEYGVPDSFRADLFPLDFERIGAEAGALVRRLPSAASLGVARGVNGPACCTPDGAPLLGPAPGHRNLWLAEGFSSGVAAAGGAGCFLAQLLTAGEAEIDMAPFDPRRFGAWTTTEYAARKAEERHALALAPRLGAAEPQAGRPLRTAPCHDRMQARGARFTAVNGWERPIWFAPPGFDEAAPAATAADATGPAAALPRPAPAGRSASASASAGASGSGRSAPASTSTPAAASAAVAASSRSAPAPARASAPAAVAGSSRAAAGSARSPASAASTGPAGPNHPPAWRGFAIEEARAVRENVGLIDATPLAKHVLNGPGATAFLDWFTCNRLPQVGRVGLTLALTEAGTVRGEYAVARTGEHAYYLVSPGASAFSDQDVLMKAVQDKLAAFGPMYLADVTTQHGVLAVAGPSARDLLATLIRDPDRANALGNARFPWLGVRNIELGMCPTGALRLSAAGELGWELHHPIEMQNYLFDLLMAAGEPLGLRLVGARAQDWLRLEKSRRAMGAELGRDVTPIEAGLDRLVDVSRDFHGKAAMEATGLRALCVTLLVEGPDDAAADAAHAFPPDPEGGEAIWRDGATVGRVTSGGWSVAFARPIAMGYVRPDLADPGTHLEIRLQGRLWPAVVVGDSPVDPENDRQRADG